VAWSLAVAGGFSVGGSASVIYSSTDGDRFVQGAGSVLVGYAISDKIGAFAEYFLISPNSKGSGTAHYVDFGVTYLLTDRTQLDATAGFGLNDESDKFFVGGGVSFLF
jgi:predicted porin